jgi:hypothetical protein
VLHELTDHFSSEDGNEAYPHQRGHRHTEDAPACLGRPIVLDGPASKSESGMITPSLARVPGEPQAGRSDRAAQKPQM